MAWNNAGGFGDFDGGYGGANDTQGGGFMNTSVTDSPGAGQRKKRSENVIPITISTIMSSTEEPILYHEKEVHMVCILGIVKSVELTSTKVSYVIDDHTGVIDVIKYNEADNDEGPKDSLAEGVYAKIYGPVRIHNGKKHILGFNVLQITDTNMITTHILEVIHAGLKYKQMKNNPGGGSAVGGNTVLPNSTVMSTSNMGGGGKTLGSREKDMVFAAIKTNTSEAGMSRNMIKSVLESKMSPAQVEKVIEELSSDGIIYTTHDDDHFQVIDD